MDEAGGRRRRLFRRGRRRGFSRSRRSAFATGSSAIAGASAAQGGRNYRFAFNDLLVMRLAKELLATRHHLDPIQRCLERVRELSNPTRPVTSLKLANDEGRIVVRDGGADDRSETGQLVFDFERSAQPGKVEDGFGPARVRERFEEARRMAESDPLKALTIYSELVGREPGNFEAHMRSRHAARTRGRLRGRAAPSAGRGGDHSRQRRRAPAARACSIARRRSMKTRCGVSCARSNATRPSSRRIATLAEIVRIDGPQARRAAPSERDPSPDQRRLRSCLIPAFELTRAAAISFAGDAARDSETNRHSAPRTQGAALHPRQLSCRQAWRRRRCRRAKTF